MGERVLQLFMPNAVAKRNPGQYECSKGLAKLGNIVEEANVSQFSCAGNNVVETNFAAWKQENVFALSQKHTCF